MLNKSYKEFSQIYDLLMNDIDYGKWTSFIMNTIGDGKKILEAACGTGNITKLLAENEYKVTAFDLSQDMLMRAYEKLERSPVVKLLNMNMTDFKIDDKFHAAICCCDGINYITFEETESFFTNIYNHLDDDSIFIFDMSTEFKYKSMFNETYVYDDGEIFYVWENMPDKENNLVDIEINFFVKDSLNKYSRINEVQTQYVHNVKKITELLKMIGFSHVEVYDDYSDKMYNNTSMRAVFCAKKEEKQ